ncbi:hypothetical protein OSB04_000687 [Centaurea solstitialis]|uniref:Uncharacterized protein n=1 Tax=Centaurea solstitialis TaxID=347529 RepID=A0AA38U279_9ASTR|nr:hypothetical protein OSB04_000687 [Centaurea solstitialis]
MVTSSGDANSKPTFHPAFTVSNIRNAIPLMLNQTDDHYASWVEFFNIHVCAYNVRDHIDEKAPRPTDVDDATWDRLDALVKQWIYSTISPDLGHSIMKPGAKALDLWKSLQEIFLNNKTTRAVYLEEQFNNTRLASFANVTEYCARLKNLADQLDNVGNPVSETKMVLQLISGLTKGEYDTVATVIQQTEPLPSFNRAKSSLLLEEARRNKPEPTMPQALITNQNHKRMFRTVAGMDRMSNLPQHLIGLILERLPVQDASVQELALTNSNRCYELPSCVSSCLELRKLELEKCIFKRLLKFEVFSNLEDLRIKMIDFGESSCGALVTLPKLRTLVLEACINVYNFNINASQLQGLRVLCCYDANLLRLLDAPCLKTVFLYFDKPVKDFVRVERMNLTRLLSNLPKIKNLTMDDHCLKYLSSGELPKWLSRPVDSLRSLQLVNCQLSDLDQLDGALCLLRKLTESREIVHVAENHLDSPGCLDQTLNRLRSVKIETFDGSRPTLLFIKLLLAHSPSLKKLTIDPSGTSVGYESLNIVIRFPQASPKAKMIFVIP